MQGWTRIVRGMLGTGLVFGIGIGAATLAVGIAAVVFGKASIGDLATAGQFGMVGFIVGVGFSGILALTSRRKSLAELPIPRIAALGGGAGLLYFLLLAVNAHNVWTSALAFSNFVLLVLMGSGAATATVLIARKARPPLATGDAIGQLGEGAFVNVIADKPRTKSAERAP